MPTIISGDGTITGLTATGISSVQNLPATGTITNLTSTTATITTLNEPSGVLATQNGMTGIAKAWVRFTVSGTTPTVVASFNISSVTYTTTGQYAFNFTTTMPNANYSVVSNGGINTSGGAFCAAVPFGKATSPFSETPTTSTFNVLYMTNLGGTYSDPSYACVVVCGN
jgi:hypothetical protein